MNFNRICPACGTPHSSDKWEGCCARGCMYFNRRKHLTTQDYIKMRTPRKMGRPKNGTMNMLSDLPKKF